MHSLDTAAYSNVVAQVLPVLLLAVLATPIANRSQRQHRRRALADLLLTAGLIGATALGEVVALFGVAHHGLGAQDTNILTTLLLAIAASAMVRLLAPAAREYADLTAVPLARVALILVVVFVAVFLGLLFSLAYV